MNLCSRTGLWCCSKDGGNNLKSVLDDYKTFGGLSVHWIMVGPSGRLTRPQQGGFLRHYTKCMPSPTDTFKTIVNTWFISGMTLHPHNFHFRHVSFNPRHHTPTVAHHVYRLSTSPEVTSSVRCKIVTYFLDQSIQRIFNLFFKTKALEETVGWFSISSNPMAGTNSNWLHRVFSKFVGLIMTRQLPWLRLWQLCLCPMHLC